jgi:CheY-like chemotaxis protein
VTAPVAIALLGAVTCIAIAVALVATLRARAAGAALRASEEKHHAGMTSTIDAPAISEPAAAAAPASEETRTAPVLVVEDEPGVRELIKRVLTLAGREVVAVAGPRAALAVLLRQPAIALMLVDVVMPEMDGYDLAAEARTISPGVHIVFMSAFAQDTARHPIRDGFLAKPFTAASLTGIVDQTLRDR